MLSNIKLILSLIPLIIELIKSIEAAFPESGKGQEKLKLVKNILIEANSEINNFWPTIEKIISHVVNFCNITGVFKR